jgi:hypothetical protein
MVAMAPSTIQVVSFSLHRLLTKYAKVGKYDKIIIYFQQMQQEGTTSVNFFLVLNACASL